MSHRDYLEYSSHLKTLCLLDCNQYSSISEKFTDYLQTLCRMFSMEIGLISRVSSEFIQTQFSFSAQRSLELNQEKSLSNTISQDVVEHLETLIIDDAAMSSKKVIHSICPDVVIKSYFAAPIFVRGQFYGLVEFLSETDRLVSFNQNDCETLELFAEKLGFILSDEIKYQRQTKRANTLDHELNQTKEWMGDLPAVTYRATVLDSSRKVFDLSEKIVTLSGFDAQEFIGANVRTFESLIHPDDQSRVNKEVLQTYQDPTKTEYMIEYRLTDSNHHIRWVYDKGMISRDSQGQAKHISGLVFDISSTKNQDQQLHYLANFDPLTNLANRSLAVDRLNQAILMASRERKSVGLISLDLNDFDEVNQMYGNQMGDALLVAVSDRLRSVVRKTDTVARFHSDRFLIVLPKIEFLAGIQLVLQKLRQAFFEPFELQDDNQKVTVSIEASLGSSSYPTDGLKASVLIHKADEIRSKLKPNLENSVGICELK